MRKRSTQMLMLCLALLCFGGAAKSENTPLMTVADPIIVYDGTILDVFLEFTPTPEETALVEVFQLDEDMLDNKEAQEARSKGWKLLGVQSDVGIFSGDTLLENRVYSERYEEASLTKGFHYVLAPSFPRENLNLTVLAELWETQDSPALESLQIEQAIPEPISAQTVSIPADMQIGEAHVDEVFVSSSDAALCVLLHFDSDVNFALPDSGFPRELPFVASFTDLSTNQQQATMELYSLPVHQPAESTPWWIFVFDPIGPMPDQILLTLEDMAGIEDTVSLRIEPLKESITVL